MKNNPLRSTLAGPLIAVVSIIATLLLVEGGYRIYLLSWKQPTYNVASGSICVFDSLFGYEYVPNARAIALGVRKGVPAMYQEVRVGPYSNLGDATSSWGETDWRILAFGDSFTADPFSYHSWTNHLGEELGKSSPVPVAVMNLGRDAYGVLQMVRLASRKVRTHMPDLVIIAFIADDVSRARFWRSTIRINGRDRLWTTAYPISSPDISIAEDVALIEPSIGLDWCRKIVSQGRSDDTLLDSLDQAYHVQAADNFRDGLGTLSTSFLYNRIAHKDPYHAIRKSSHFPQVTIHDFLDDSAFVQDMHALDTAGVPVVWIMLPTLQDLKAGKYVCTDQQKELLESLRRFIKAPQKFVDVMSLVQKETKAAEALYLAPVDTHPSEEGSRIFAKTIASAIQPYLPSR